MQFPPALRHRNYRIFFTGLVISQIGVWMQTIAMSWLAYRLTGSVFMLGLVGFASQIPVLFLAPVGGVLADRFNRRKLMMTTQTVALCQASTLAVLTLTGIVQPWHLVALSLLLGTIYAVDVPVRQSMSAHLIDDPKDLPNAITMNGMSFNLSRLIGPAIGGAVVAAYGEGACFTLNVMTYAIAIGFLSRLQVHSSGNRGLGLAGGLQEGFRFAFGRPETRALLAMSGAVALTTLPYSVLLPYFAKNVFSGHADTLGLLMSAMSFGGVGAVFYALGRRTIPGVPPLIYRAAVVMGLALILFPLMPGLWLAVIPIAVAGGATFLIGNGASTLVQIMVPDALRGRMMAIFTMFWFGMVPVGSLAVGAIADVIGPEHAIALCGWCCMVAGVLFRRTLPRFYSVLKPKVSDA